MRVIHDAKSKITQRLPPPDNVHIFGCKKAETVTIERLKVALHGQSVAKRDTLENLASSYPTARKGWCVMTLLDPEEGVLDDGALKPFLETLELPFFERIFGLDHEQLREGGEALLKDGGEAGLGLFEAGAGLAGMRKVLEGIDGDAGQLFRPRGQNQLIN